MPVQTIKLGIGIVLTYRIDMNATPLSNRTSPPTHPLEFKLKANFHAFLAAGEAEQIQLSVLVFSMFLFLNLYPYCQSRVSFGYLDFQGTSPYGTLYPLGHFTLWGPLTLGAFCPQGPFALHDLLLIGSFRLFGSFGFFSYCRQQGLKGLQSC